MARQYRISTPMSQETKEAFEELARVTGASFGSTVASFLEELTPSILRLTEVYKEVKINPSVSVHMINKLANESHISLHEEQIELLKKVNDEKEN